MACGILNKDLFSLNDILSEKQVSHILEQEIGEKCQVIAADVKRAAEGIAGFLGDHFRLTLHVKTEWCVKKIRLFVKHMPLKNKPKAEFVTDSGFYVREKLIVQWLQEVEAWKDPIPWCAKAFIVTDTMLVMPDLAETGYLVRPSREYLDLPHVLLAAASIARFHATYFNYETKRSILLNRPYTFVQEHKLDDINFKDCPWLRTAAKLTADLIREFSNSYSKIPDLQEKLTEHYIEACDGLKEYNDTVNVVIHKDLWVNNLLFQYEGGAPVNAVIVDFQCARYSLPTFDVMIFLYLSTSRSFRDAHEATVLKHYYEIFMSSLEEESRRRIKKLKFDLESFQQYCELCRSFAAVEAIGIYPYILLDPSTAQKIFDDPDTFMWYTEVDRSEPVIDIARKDLVYRNRQLEVSEEFIERFVLKM